HGTKVGAVSLDRLDGRFDLIINGTSAGLDGDGGLIAPALAAGAQCYDLLYSRDGQTPFCRWAKQAGAAWVSDGLGMLVEQAAAAFAIWRGRAPSTRDLLRSLRSGTAA
ncbi:MAG: shikimate dehydrogenase, partial [Gammaproteobacteria bacterium]|nr:shikimate dehydrogenase [Gammaproteobacteria bacterium]